MDRAPSISFHLVPAARGITSLLQIKFFERVKLERRIAKLEKQRQDAATAGGGGRLGPEEEQQLAQLRDDLLVRGRYGGTGRYSGTGGSGTGGC